MPAKRPHPMKYDEGLVAEELEKDPVFFASYALGHDHWETAQEVMRTVAWNPHARVAVKSCHSSSKTFSAVDLVLYWTNRGGICLTTAPTFRQVRRVLWNQIRKTHRHAKLPLGGTMLTTEYQVSESVYALGLTTESATALQGFKGEILVIVDEAPGVLAEVWEAIEGMRAGGDVRVLMLGNPTEVGGPFYDAFHSQRKTWKTWTINAFYTPNFEPFREPGDKWETILERLLELERSGAELPEPPRPYLVTPRWVLEKHHDWGTDSPLWEARVLGEFPAFSERKLIPLSWLLAAREELELRGKPRRAAGIDVAGEGEDETVVYAGEFGENGMNILGAPFATAKPEPQGECVRYLRDQVGEPKPRVNYDSIGVGTYFPGPLREAGFKCRGVNVGTAAKDSERFKNKKAELYWGLRDRFRDGAIGGLTDEKTIAQLAAIEYETTPRGQIIIQSKESYAKENGGESPDRAEALMLLGAPPGRDARRRISIR